MNKVFHIKDVNSLNKFFVLDRREQFRKNPPPGLDRKRCAFIEGDFAMIMSFIHGFELLINYGLKSFYVFLKSFIDGENNTGQQTRIKSELLNNAELNALYTNMKNAYELNDTSKIPKNCLKHPKLAKLEEIILQHFQSHASGMETRFRPSCLLI
jgi:Fanconi anemia group M protein